MSNLTNTVKKLSVIESKTGISIKPQSLQMCVSSYSPVQLENTEDLQTWLQQDFHVNHSQSQDSETQKMMNGICGLQLSELLEKYSQKFVFSKTCLDFCRLEKGEWRTSQKDLFADTSEPYCETFPKAGTLQSGVCSELMMSTVSTEGKDCGLNASDYPTPTREGWRSQGHVMQMRRLVENSELSKDEAESMMGSSLNPERMLPTPQATDGSVGSVGSVIADDDEFFYNESGNLRKVNGKGTEGSAGLARKVMIESWPTPRACESEGGATKCDYKNGSFSRENSKGVRFGVKLKDAVNMFPTPQASDDRDRGNKQTPCIKRRKEKGKQIMLSQSVSDISGSLNPDWAEALMMWPIGWSSTEPLTELNWDIDCSNWEPDIPRVKPKEKNHANRLKAIGNGQVPLCVATAWKILTAGE